MAPDQIIRDCAPSLLAVGRALMRRDSTPSPSGGPRVRPRRESSPSPSDGEQVVTRKGLGLSRLGPKPTAASVLDILIREITPSRLERARERQVKKPTPSPSARVLENLCSPKEPSPSDYRQREAGRRILPSPSAEKPVGMNNRFIPSPSGIRLDNSTRASPPVVPPARPSPSGFRRATTASKRARSPSGSKRASWIKNNYVSQSEERQERFDKD